MARLARVVTVDIPYHITQRGNARRLVFETDTGRLVHLRLLQCDCKRHGSGPARLLNARQSASGHVWQGRFYYCPLDTPHLWAALRYTGRNPLRAGIDLENSVNSPSLIALAEKFDPFMRTKGPVQYALRAGVALSVVPSVVDHPVIVGCHFISKHADEGKSLVGTGFSMYVSGVSRQLDWTSLE
jgi:hypothetical protein